MAHESYGEESINPVWVLHAINELKTELKELKEKHCKLQADFIAEQEKMNEFASNVWEILDVLGRGGKILTDC